MNRAEATKRVDRLLERVVRGEGRYLPRMRRIDVFGSYARGALEVGDVDLNVEFDQTPEERASWFVDLLWRRVNHRAEFQRELRGNQRILQIQFNELHRLRAGGFEPKLLWQRGDSLERARERLARLKPDTSAGPGVLDFVHPLLAEVAKSITRPARELFSLFCWARWIDAELVELPRAYAENRETSERFARHWSFANPRWATAHAVAAHLEKEGIAPLSAGGVVQSDRRVAPRCGDDFGVPCVNVHFGAVQLEPALYDFGHGFPRAIVVLNPSAEKRPLRALDMRARVDEETFLAFRDDQGKKKMRERLAVAERKGELPDYLVVPDSWRADG